MSRYGSSRGMCWGQKRGAHRRKHATVYRIYSLWRTSWIDTAECQEHIQHYTSRWQHSDWENPCLICSRKKKRQKKEAVDLRVDITVVHLTTIMWLAAYELYVVHNNISWSITRRKEITLISYGSEVNQLILLIERPCKIKILERWEIVAWNKVHEIFIWWLMLKSIIGIMI